MYQSTQKNCLLNQYYLYSFNEYGDKLKEM